MRRFAGTRLCTVLLVLSVMLGTRPRRSPAACVGDCNDSGDVTVNELITMVNVALGSALVSTCPVGDPDGSGDITINEIITAVNNALGVCPLPASTPTPTVLLATPTPSVSPTLGALGIRHFELNPAHSLFSVVGVIGNTPFDLGGFHGQKNGEFGLAGYLDLQAGQPDDRGFATIDVVDASDYLYVDASVAGVVCIKLTAPVTSAGIIACNGGVDFSLAVTQNHHLGQVDVDGFTADQCTSQGGVIEGLDHPHPGVCNGTYEIAALGSDSGPGAVTISQIPELGLKGLQAELSIEQLLPCGDEGPGTPTPFAFISTAYRSMILNTGNMTDICSTGANPISCVTNADCDSAPAAGDGVCGATLTYDSDGQDFSCADWQASNAPGCLVFSAPQLDSNPLTVGADVIAAFKFCGQ